MIIALDGASTDLSVALVDSGGGRIAEDAWTSAQRQSAELLPRLLALLPDGRSLHGATLIAVGTGPGSFTGLRVAMALAKGLAFGCGVPIIGVASLAAWLEAEPDAVAAVARAGAREAYLLERGAAAPSIVDRDMLPSGGAVVAPAELAEAFSIPVARRPRGAVPIARHAAARLAADPAGDDLRTLEPIYLRRPRGVLAESGEPVRWL